MDWLIDGFVLGVRALSLLAIFQAIGAWLFLRRFETELTDPAADSIRALVRWTALAAVVLAMSYYLLIPARMAGSFEGLSNPVLRSIVADSSARPAQIAAFSGLALIAVSIGVRSRFHRSLCLIGAALAMLSFALTGHTSLHDLRPLLAPLLVIHVVVAAAWFGSLWPLGIVAMLEKTTTTARVAGLFSGYALKAVPLLFLCGLGMTFVLTGSIAGLATPYGAMLGLKFAAFIIVLAIANHNRTRLTPAIAADDARAVRRFCRNLLAETLLLAMVVGVTVVMTGLFAPGS